MECRIALRVYVDIIKLLLGDYAMRRRQIGRYDGDVAEPWKVAVIVGTNVNGQSNAYSSLSLNSLNSSCVLESLRLEL